MQLVGRVDGPSQELSATETSKPRPRRPARDAEQPTTRGEWTALVVASLATLRQERRHPHTTSELNSSTVQQHVPLGETQRRRGARQCTPRLSVLCQWPLLPPLHPSSPPTAAASALRGRTRRAAPCRGHAPPLPELQCAPPPHPMLPPQASVCLAHAPRPPGPALPRWRLPLACCQPHHPRLPHPPPAGLPRRRRGRARPRQGQALRQGARPQRRGAAAAAGAGGGACVGASAPPRPGPPWPAPPTPAPCSPPGPRRRRSRAATPRWGPARGGNRAAA